jgi:ABC-type nitrate/sulfonate/bicarbonate transport system permease component
LAFTLLLVALWELSGAREGSPAYVLPPSEIVLGLVQLARDGMLFDELLLSLRRQMSGFLIGATSGVILGLLAGVIRPAEDIFDTLVSLTYPLPKIALFPVAVVWLGFTDTARILIISVSCFYPAFVNAHSGTRGIDLSMVWAARNFGASRWRTFWQVVFRAAMPSIAVGVRISLALSFVLTFATETIGASRGGLGHLIDEGFNNRIFTWLYAGVVCFAILGFLADKVWTAISGSLLRGQATVAVGRG